MGDYQNILLAADLSDTCAAPAKQAIHLAARFGARLTVLYVLQHFPEDMPVAQIPPETADPQAYLTRLARDRLTDLCASHGLPDAHIEIIISPHSAKREVIDYAEHHGIDLIIVGSHGQHGVLGALGSTASGILHAATIDVLAVRNGT